MRQGRRRLFDRQRGDGRPAGRRRGHRKSESLGARSGDSGRGGGAGLYIGAICAAPSILGEKGLLDGKRATCFPAFAPALANAIKVEDKVVTDDIFITAEGMGVSFAFGLALITVLYGEAKAEEVRLSTRAG